MLSTAWHEGVVVPLLVGIAVLPMPGLGRTARANQAALVGLALCTLPAIVLIRHFRDNDFAGRYFSFAAYWAVAAAVHGALVLAGAFAGPRVSLVRLGAVAVLVAVVPRGPADPLAAPRQEAARLTGAEVRVLLGGYWHVYVPASLAPWGAPADSPGRATRIGSRRSGPSFGPDVRCSLPARWAEPMEPSSSTARCSGARRIPPVSAEGGPWCLHHVERAARPLRHSPRRPPLRMARRSGQSPSP